MSSLARAAAKGAFVEEYNKTSTSSPKKKQQKEKKKQSKKKKKRASTAAFVVGAAAAAPQYRDYKVDNNNDEEDTVSVISTSYQIPDHGQHDASSFNSLQHHEPYRDHVDDNDLDTSSKSGGGRSSSIQPMTYVVGGEGGPSSPSPPLPKEIGGQGGGGRGGATSNSSSVSSSSKPKTITTETRGKTYSSYQQNVNTKSEIDEMRRKSAPPVYANNFHPNNNGYYEEWGMAGLMVSCIADACKKSADYALRTGYDTIYPTDHHHHSNSKMEFERVGILNSYHNNNHHQSSTGGRGNAQGGRRFSGGQFSGET